MQRRVDLQCSPSPVLRTEASARSRRSPGAVTRTVVKQELRVPRNSVRVTAAYIHIYGFKNYQHTSYIRLNTLIVQKRLSYPSSLHCVFCDAPDCLPRQAPAVPSRAARLRLRKPRILPAQTASQPPPQSAQSAAPQEATSLSQVRRCRLAVTPP